MRTFGHKMPLQNGSSPKFCPSLLLIYYTTASNSFGPTQLPLPRLHQEATFQFVHGEMVWWWWRYHPLTSSVGVVKSQLGCHAWISVNDSISSPRSAAARLPVLSRFQICQFLYRCYYYCCSKVLSLFIQTQQSAERVKTDVWLTSSSFVICNL